MPYKVTKTDKCPASKPWGVIKVSDGKLMGCHPTKAKANDQVAAIEANTDEEHRVNSLTDAARRHVVLHAGSQFGINAPGVKRFKKPTPDKGTILVLENVPVFRSGTFRDSMGFQHTWDDIHMMQMKSHYDILTERKFVESFPVRKGHGSFLGEPMDGLIGWHTKLETEKRTNPVDGVEYTYLLADYEILEPDAINKIESGLWRDLSAEITSWVTNDEMEFWPVYGGVAYVDFSAVEGLREFSKHSNHISLMFENEKEAPVVGADNSTGQPDQASGTPQQGTPAPAQGTPPADQGGQQTAPPAAPPADQGAATAPGTEQGAATDEDEDVEDGGDHTKGGTLFVFKLYGKPTLGLPIKGLTGPQLQAFQSAQAHIDYLEKYRKGQLEGHRTEFVKGLATNNKILATEIPNMTKVALEMSDEAFSLWSAAYASAPKQPLFDQHGQTPTDQGAPQQTDVEARKDRISVLEAIVADHRRSGFTKEKLEATSTWNELQTLLKVQNPQS